MSWLRKYVWQVLYAIVILFVVVYHAVSHIIISATAGSSNRSTGVGGNVDGGEDVRRTRWR